MKLGNTVLCTALALLAVALIKVHGQALPPNGELPIELRARLVPDASAIDLVVPKSDTAGVVELYGAGEVENLFSRPSTLHFTNAPASGDLLWRVPAEQRAFYCALLRSGVSLADYAMPDWNESADPTNQVALMVWGVPETLKTGAPLSASFLLVKSDGDVAPLAPSGKLKILSWETGLPHPDATVVPEALTFTNGHAAAQVVITAATSLDGYTLGIQWEGNTPVWPSGGIGKAGLSGGPDSSFVLPASRFDSFFDVEALASAPGTLSKAWRDFMISHLDLQPDWGQPLAAPAAVTGSFGEWRGHIRTGPDDNVHAGLDLKANAGDIVVASRGGWIIKNDGKADGRYVTVNHLDGTYSRYLHLLPQGTKDAKRGPVKRGQRLGLVGTPGGVPHLHFEIRRDANALMMNQGMPGVGVDPVREPGLFPVVGLDNLPILEAFQVSGEHPASRFIPYAGDTSGSPAAGGKAYVIVQLHQKRLDGIGGGLTPKAVQMEWEGGGGPVGFDLEDETAVNQAKPARSIGSRAGFAIYQHGNATNAVYPKVYRFWFEWDTSAYAFEPNGPRTLTLKSKSYSTQSSISEWQLRWGPEIESVEPVGDVGADGKREYEVKVKYWRGDPVVGGAEPARKGHDWYEYELSEGGVWIASGNIQGGGSKTQDKNGTAAGRTLHFKLPVEAATKGWVKVSSGRVPMIGHRKEPVACSPASQPSAPPGFVWIPPGTFMMGSPASEPESNRYETQHTVKLTQGFFMGRYEVTQSEYTAVMEVNPSSFKGENLPVEKVNWFDATNYCFKLTARERKAGRLPDCWEYRLPTEAQWEYGCRAGITTATAFGNSLSGAQANFNGRRPYPNPSSKDEPAGIYKGVTTPVGSYAPNAWGLYDMHGNVWEWCADWYDDYPNGSITDPKGPFSGVNRVYRGGGWDSYGRNCRSANRYGNRPGFQYGNLGFRAVLVQVP